MNEGIRDAILKNMQKWESGSKEAFQTWRMEVTAANTHEEATAAKRNLLIRLLQWIPIRQDTCSFCLEHKRAFGPPVCERCPFGEVKGICGQSTSTWGKLNKQFQRLERTVMKTYSLRKPRKERR